MSLFALTTAALCIRVMAVGGGLYEFIVLDRAWPKHPEIIQPRRGGVKRAYFWAPMHIVFELVLIACLIYSGSVPDARSWLWIALVSHATMRIWSFMDFIPKAAAFERADKVDELEAKKWVQRSPFRMPLDLVTCYALMQAFLLVVRATA